MKKFYIFAMDNMLLYNDTIRRFTFKTMDFKDALLAMRNHQLAMRLAVLWVESALLAVVCTIQVAVLRLTRDHYAHLQKEDCFECLSPHIEVFDGVYRRQV